MTEEEARFVEMLKERGLDPRIVPIVGIIPEFAEIFVRALNVSLEETLNRFKSPMVIRTRKHGAGLKESELISLAGDAIRELRAGGKRLSYTNIAWKIGIHQGSLHARMKSNPKIREKIDALREMPPNSRDSHE